MKTYKLDFEIGYGCNFRCRYCFEQYSSIEYRNKFMPNDIIDRSCLFARHVLTKIPKEDRLSIAFFGGEPLLYPDSIVRVVENLIDTPIVYSLITNGSLIQQNKDMLFHIKNITKNKMFINVSYDFSLQEKNRHKNTYKLVRDNIVWLHTNGFRVGTITVLPEDDLSEFYNVFVDYLNLRRRAPSLRMYLNFNHGNKVKDFDEVATQAAFEKVRNYIKRNKEMEYIPVYSAGCGLRGEQWGDNVFGRVYVGIDINGDMYPGYSVIYNDEETKNALWLGNVTDDFEILDKYRKELIASLPPDIGEECHNCVHKCQLLPWNTLRTRLDEYNALPDTTHCKLHKLVMDYLHFKP